MWTKPKTLTSLAMLIAIAIIGVYALAGPAPYEKTVDDTVAQCVAITASSVQYTIPTAVRGQWFYLVAVDNTAYLLGGSNPTATTAVGGFAISVPDSAPIMMRLSSAKIAVIGKSAAGTICFIPQKVT